MASPLSSNISLQLLDSMVSTPVYEIFIFASKWSNIAIIGATTFLYILKLLGSDKF